MNAFVAVVTTDLSSGRQHVRVQEMNSDGTVRRTLTDERCQADQSGAFEVNGPLTDALLTTIRESNGRGCRFCFGPPVAL